jgi:tetratricopeptide (TPR) repeat protein
VINYAVLSESILRYHSQILIASRLADSLYTLANVRVAKRDFDAALDGFKEAFSILRDELGEHHRLTANCCYCLARILNRQRKYNAAM